MKTISKIFLGVALLLALPACKDKMQELNTNPDIQTESDPRYLFLRAIRNYKCDSFWANNGKLGAMTQVQFNKDRTTDSQALNNATDQAPRNGIGMDSFAGNYYASGTQWGLYLKDLIQTIDQWGDPSHPTYDNIKYQRWIEIRSMAMICWMDLTIEMFFVQGAAVFTQAFQAFDGVTRPEYDLAQDVIETIDTNLKGAIAVLAGAKNTYAETDMASYDRIFGWTANTSKPEKFTDYTVIRSRWAKYGNAIRLRMAFMLQHVQAGRFKTVVNEALASGGLMEGNGDSAFFNFGYQEEVGSEMAYTYNYFATTAYVSNLKRTNDPRLPLLVRTNDNYTAGKGFDHPYWYMKSFFPDSLQYRKIGATNVPWGDMLAENNVFEGLSANPYRILPVQPNTRITTPDITFRIANPNGTSPYYAVSAVDGQNYKVMQREDTTITIRVASPAQTRYRVMASGGRSGFGTSGGTMGDGNGDDGPAWDQESENTNIYKREPLFTYPEMCFMMAYMSASENLGGKSAAQWYNAGVEAAFEQLSKDSKRYRITITTNPDTPKIPGVNPGGIYDLTPAMFSTYIAANGYSGQESVAYQAWIHFSAGQSPQSFNMWYRVTGYPATWEKTELTYDERTGPATFRPWLERRMIDGATKGAFPHRGSVPEPNALNRDNWESILQDLYAQPGYGTDYRWYTGRLWYDTQAERTF